MIVGLPSHHFLSLLRILYSLTRIKTGIARMFFILYSLVSFLYSLVFFFTRPPEPPRRRRIAVFPRNSNGFGSFWCPQRAAMFFSLLAPPRRPGGAEMAVFLRISNDFGDFRCRGPPALFFSLLACFFLYSLVFILYSPRVMKKTFAPSGPPRFFTHSRR